MTEEHEDDFNGYDKVNEIRAAYNSATCKKSDKRGNGNFVSFGRNAKQQQKMQNLQETPLLQSIKTFLQDGKIQQNGRQETNW